ncbi:MAG: hypothetical protein MRK02_13825 [Candidatus Scalindua sp.]|nr:hypothetical protein [Candidatus Scalindua sp.]
MKNNICFIVCGMVLTLGLSVMGCGKGNDAGYARQGHNNNYYHDDYNNNRNSNQGYRGESFHAGPFGYVGNNGETPTIYIPESDYSYIGD